MAKKFNYVVDGKFVSSSEAYYVVDGVYKKVASAFYTVDGQHRQVFDASGGSGNSEYHIVFSIHPDSRLPSSYGYDTILYANGERYDDLRSVVLAPGTEVSLEIQFHGDSYMWIERWETNLSDYNNYGDGCIMEFTMPSEDVTLSAVVNCDGESSETTYYDIYYHGSAFISTPQQSAYYGQEVRFEANAIDGNDFIIYGLRTGCNYGSPAAMHSGAYYLFTMPDESVEVVYTKD
jgi:hypothetical protein